MSTEADDTHYYLYVESSKEELAQNLLQSLYSAPLGAPTLHH